MSPRKTKDEVVKSHAEKINPEGKFTYPDWVDLNEMISGKDIAGKPVSIPRFVQTPSDRQGTLRDNLTTRSVFPTSGQEPPRLEQSRASLKTTIIDPYAPIGCMAVHSAPTSD